MLLGGVTMAICNRRGSPYHTRTHTDAHKYATTSAYLEPACQVLCTLGVNFVVPQVEVLQGVVGLQV